MTTINSRTIQASVVQKCCEAMEYSTLIGVRVEEVDFIH